MRLDPALLEGFSEAFLRPKYDEAVVTPPFHREMWADFCDESKQHVAFAAPRDHAKSTSITHTCALAAAVFGFRDYILIISDTEGQVVKFLGDIKMELTENELLIREFGIELPFIKDTETEIVFKCSAGLINITAKGAEQKVRGLKWRGKRPNLVLVDDLENDESVMNKERRDKLRSWVLTALLPCGSKRCLFRVVGTILHLDSFLSRVLEDHTWFSRLYAAHNHDFSQILWPEKFSKERLQAIRRRFVAQGKPEKYSQEYLNKPLDEENAYFKQVWMLPFEKAMKNRRFRNFAAIDLAVSKSTSADYCVLGVGGVDPSNLLHVRDIIRGRFDSLETVEHMFAIQTTYQPDLFFVEKGPLHRAFLPFLNAEMQRRGIFINLHAIPSTADKQTRARSLQAKMRSGSMRFDTGAAWFGELQSELTRFPRDKHDDQVDMLSLLAQGLDQMRSAETDEEVEEEEYLQAQRTSTQTGRSEVCGY